MGKNNLKLKSYPTIRTLDYHTLLFITSEDSNPPNIIPFKHGSRVRGNEVLHDNLKYQYQAKGKTIKQD